MESLTLSDFGPMSAQRLSTMQITIGHLNTLAHILLIGEGVFNWDGMWDWTALFFVFTGLLGIISMQTLDLSPAKRNEHYDSLCQHSMTGSDWVLWLSVTQIVIGIWDVLLAVVLYGVDLHILTALLSFLTGIFGIVYTRKRTTSFILRHIMLALIQVVVTIAILLASAFRVIQLKVAFDHNLLIMTHITLALVAASFSYCALYNEDKYQSLVMKEQTQDYNEQQEAVHNSAGMDKYKMEALLNPPAVLTTPSHYGRTSVQALTQVIIIYLVIICDTVLAATGVVYWRHWHHIFYIVTGSLGIASMGLNVVQHLYGTVCELVTVHKTYSMSDWVLWLSVIQIIMGTSDVLLQLALYVADVQLFTALFSILTGTFGIVSTQRKTASFILTYFVLASILAAVAIAVPPVPLIWMQSGSAADQGRNLMEIVQIALAVFAAGFVCGGLLDDDRSQSVVLTEQDQDDNKHRDTSANKNQEKGDGDDDDGGDDDGATPNHAENNYLDEDNTQPSVHSNNLPQNMNWYI